MLIDTHAHLFAKEFDEDRREMIQRAFDAGVEKMYLPNINIATVRPMLDLASSYPDRLFPMLGLHPCYIKDNFDEELRAMEERIEGHIDQMVAIGETGLDFYWDTSFRDEQLHSLEKHVEWALKYDLPIVLHSRSAIDETISCMEKWGKGKIRGVFHCFTGTLEQAQRIIDLGFFIGIGGILTFKNAGLDRVVERIPLDAMVLETDAPYLAPHPHRSERNEPSFLPLIAEKMAKIKSVPHEHVEERTSGNARRLFRNSEGERP